MIRAPAGTALLFVCVSPAFLPAALARGDAKVELTPQRIAARIRKHRTAEVTLTLTDAAGKPLANRPVTVGQVRQKFLFGCNAFRIDPNDQSKSQLDYRRRYAELLNFATLPFYWGMYEPQLGRTAARRVRAMAEWCRTNDIRTKGHPLCWHTVFPRWGLQKSVDEIGRLQLHRIEREVKGFVGLIDTWDVVNEAVVMPDFSRDENLISKLCKQI
ncbi:MAG: endo-1,4-beta-xylanase, partial [Phycisphaerae bacterium]